MDAPVAPAHDGPDPYAWMRDTSDPAMLSYLAAERAYYDEQTAHTASLRDELAEEMSARLAPSEESSGWELGGWHYFTRTLPGLDYEQFCRRSLAGGAEEVLLDENLLLDDPDCGGDYLALGVREVSPDGRLLAYSVDFDGDEVYQLRVRDLATGTDRPERIEHSYYGLAWSADSRAVFYTVTDPIYRPYQVWRHDVGTAAGDDECVFTEEDERFEVFVRASRSGALIFIECESRDTTEIHYLEAANRRSFPIVVRPRRRGTEYRADHGDGELYIVTNDGASEFRLVKAPLTAADDWSEVVPESAGTRLVSCDVFARYLHVQAREFGFYNGVSSEDAGPGGSRLGLEAWARHGIAGRGVLADVAGYLAARGTPLDPRREFAITAELLASVLASRGTVLLGGDILLVRTGFVGAYLRADAAGRENFAARQDCPGLAADEDMARYLWDHRFAAIAADNHAVESQPGSPAVGFLHRRLIPLLGFAIGEWFDLDSLAQEGAATGRYSCFFAGVPLNLPGGVGSPANSIAIT